MVSGNNNELFNGQPFWQLLSKGSKGRMHFMVRKDECGFTN